MIMMLLLYHFYIANFFYTGLVNECPWSTLYAC